MSDGFGKVDLQAYDRHNTLIAFSADAGQQAADGEGNNSPYTRVLLDHIGDDLSVADLLTKVRGRVLTDTANRQRPREDSTLGSVFKFPLSTPAPVVQSPGFIPVDDRTIEHTRWMACSSAS